MIHVIRFYYFSEKIHFIRFYLPNSLHFGKDSEGRSKATKSEGDDLEESAARALMHHGGGGRSGRG